MKKFQKIFDLIFSMTKKKLLLRLTLQNIHTPQYSKLKKSKKFLTSNLAWPKKVGAQTAPVKNSESRVLGKWSNSEKFLTSNLVWPKKFGTWTPLVKNSESRALCKLKNSKKFLTSNLVWPKNVGDWTSPAMKIQSPESSVNEKNSKKFLT